MSFYDYTFGLCIPPQEETKRNRFVLMLAPIGQDREEKEQVFTEAGLYWSGYRGEGIGFS
jgi:hypothetical protein